MWNYNMEFGKQTELEMYNKPINTARGSRVGYEKTFQMLTECKFKIQ